MDHKNPEDNTFQVTVGQLTHSSQLSKAHIHVTVCVGDVSKTTCSGELSEDGLTVTWNHPFLFTATPSMDVGVAVCILPEELTSEWDKQPLGDRMVANVASLLDSGNVWQCNISGLSPASATLTIACMATDILVNFVTVEVAYD